MAAPARPGRVVVALGITLLVAAVVGAAIVVLESDGPSPPAKASSSVAVHGTRPPRLVEHDIARATSAFGIDAEPERIRSGWEAEDPVRSMYLLRSPSAWYLTFADSSILLEPPGDRAAICATEAAPFACTLPGIQLVADTTADPPDAATATRAARGVLQRAGLLTGTWSTFVLDPSVDVPPCRTELETMFDCSRQVVPTRAVMLTREFGAGTTAARFGIVVGPGGRVLSVTGRVAEHNG